MRASTLPSPGRLANSQRLRHEAAHAISTAEVVAGKTVGGKTTSAAELATFFTACATALVDIKDGTAPEFSSAVVEDAAPTKLVITFSENMDETVLPGASAFVTSPAKTISAREWLSATELELTVSVAFANGDTITVAYTEPTTNWARDIAGNKVATFAAEAVTNNVAL